jgi:hypothetical protein
LAAIFLADTASINLTGNETAQRIMGNNGTNVIVARRRQRHHHEFPRQRRHRRRMWIGVRKFAGGLTQVYPPVRLRLMAEPRERQRNRLLQHRDL